MIVLEGADNSGKTTFAKQFALTYFSAGPAPSDTKELRQCIVDQRGRASMPCVQDRLTCISQQVYSQAPESSYLQKDLEELVNTPRVIIVYCRPPERTLVDLSTHKAKSYDTEEAMEKLAREQHLYIQRYDDIMAKIPHVVYDYTDHDDESTAHLRGTLVTTQHSTEDWRIFCDTMKIASSRY